MKDLTGSINFNPSPPTAGLSLGADFDAQAQRIRQLERQVNDLGSAIAMSAAYLGLIPLERGAGVVTRDEAMELMEKVGSLAERWLAFSELERIRPLGSAGCSGDSIAARGDNAHMGLELWTKFKNYSGPTADYERATYQDWMGVFIEKAIEVRRKRLAADRDRLAIAAGLVATSRQT